MLPVQALPNAKWTLTPDLGYHHWQVCGALQGILTHGEIQNYSINETSALLGYIVCFWVYKNLAELGTVRTQITEL